MNLIEIAVITAIAACAATALGLSIAAWRARPRPRWHVVARGFTSPRLYVVDRVTSNEDGGWFHIHSSADAQARADKLNNQPDPVVREELERLDRAIKRLETGPATRHWEITERDGIWAWSVWRSYEYTNDVIVGMGDEPSRKKAERAVERCLWREHRQRIIGTITAGHRRGEVTL